MLTMCTIVAMNIMTLPGGSGQAVGIVPAYKQVEIEQVSFLRDYVFVSRPGPDGASPRGWIAYGGLGQCQQ
jgi:hypothetical protein